MSRATRRTDLFEGIVFDMDGILFDTEHIWHEVRGNIATERGGHWDEDDQRAVMGMNSAQWSTYMHEQCGVPEEPEAIYAEVVARLRDRYRVDPPIYAGASEAVASLAAVYRLAVASSSPLELIVTGIEAAGLGRFFEVLVSSDAVEHGKPAPDVYLEACSRLGIRPTRAAAVEDSTNGIRAAASAGLRVIAVPNPGFPPASDAVTLAGRVLGSISELTPEVVEALAGC